MRTFSAEETKTDRLSSDVNDRRPHHRSGGRPWIVLGVDGSAASIDALRWAAKHAALTDALVEAATSWGMPASGVEVDSQ